MPVNLRSLAEKRDEFDVDLMGETAHIAYRTDRLTREFRAQALRLNRDVLKIQKRQERLFATATLIEAEEGTPEAEQEDAAAERAIEELAGQGDELTAKVDILLCGILLDWDLVDGDETIPITPEGLKPIPLIFKAMILEALMKQGNQGEAVGARPLNSLPSLSKPREPQETSRPSQNGTDTSKPADIVQP